MPLSVLLILVVGGIAGIALLLHLLGYSRRARLSDAKAAGALWADRYPGAPLIDVTLTEDRTAALIRSQAGPGVIWAFGSDFVVRDLTLDHFTLRENADRVVIHTDDGTAPHIALTLTKAERPTWYAVLGAPRP